MAPRGSSKVILALIFLTGLVAASEFSAMPIGNVILPASDAALGKQLTVHPGDVILRQTVVRGGVAHLVAPLSVAIADKARTLTADDPLEEMHLLEAPEGFATTAHMFCATPNFMDTAAAASKAVVGAMAFGLFGRLQRTEVVNRFCLIDKDADGTADAVILQGAKRAEDVAPVQIQPARLNIERNVPLKGPSEVDLTYLGPIGILGNVGFESHYQVAGARVETGAARQAVSKAHLPKTVSIDGGAHLTLLGFDPGTKAATIQIDKPFDTGAVHFPPVVQHIYVAVPSG